MSARVLIKSSLIDGFLKNRIPAVVVRWVFKILRLRSV